MSNNQNAGSGANQPVNSPATTNPATNAQTPAATSAPSAPAAAQPSVRRKPGQQIPVAAQQAPSGTTVNLGGAPAQAQTTGPTAPTVSLGRNRILDLAQSAGAVTPAAAPAQAPASAAPPQPPATSPNPVTTPPPVPTTQTVPKQRGALRRWGGWVVGVVVLGTLATLGWNAATNGKQVGQTDAPDQDDNAPRSAINSGNGGELDQPTPTEEPIIPVPTRVVPTANPTDPPVPGEEQETTVAEPDAPAPEPERTQIPEVEYLSLKVSVQEAGDFGIENARAQIGRDGRIIFEFTSDRSIVAAVEDAGGANDIAAIKAEWSFECDATRCTAIGENLTSSNTRRADAFNLRLFGKDKEKGPTALLTVTGMSLSSDGTKLQAKGSTDTLTLDEPVQVISASKSSDLTPEQAVAEQLLVRYGIGTMSDAARAARDSAGDRSIA